MNYIENTYNSIISNLNIKISSDEMIFLRNILYINIKYNITDIYKFLLIGNNEINIPIYMKIYFMKISEDVKFWKNQYILFILYFYNPYLIKISDNIYQNITFRMLENFDRSYLFENSDYINKLTNIIYNILLESYKNDNIMNMHLINVQSLIYFIIKYPIILENEFIQNKLIKLVYLYINRFSSLNNIINNTIYQYIPIYIFNEKGLININNVYIYNKDYSHINILLLLESNDNEYFSLCDILNSSRIVLNYKNKQEYIIPKLNYY